MCASYFKDEPISIPRSDTTQAVTFNKATLKKHYLNWIETWQLCEVQLMYTKNSRLDKIQQIPRLIDGYRRMIRRSDEWDVTALFIFNPKQLMTEIETNVSLQTWWHLIPWNPHHISAHDWLTSTFTIVPFQWKGRTVRPPCTLRRPISGVCPGVNALLT